MPRLGLLLVIGTVANVITAVAALFVAFQVRTAACRLTSAGRYKSRLLKTTKAVRSPLRLQLQTYGAERGAPLLTCPNLPLPLAALPHRRGSSS
jgi:hypothetical protein